MPTKLRKWVKDNLPGVDPDWEASKFKDFWLAATKNAMKKDWDAAFRNWCRKAYEDRKKFNPDGDGPKPRARKEFPA